jgi:hypothetical protein
MGIDMSHTKNEYMSPIPILLRHVDCTYLNQPQSTLDHRLPTGSQVRLPRCPINDEATYFFLFSHTPSIFLVSGLTSVLFPLQRSASPNPSIPIPPPSDPPLPAPIKLQSLPSFINALQKKLRTLCEFMRLSVSSHTVHQCTRSLDLFFCRLVTI